MVGNIHCESLLDTLFHVPQNIIAICMQIKIAEAIDIKDIYEAAAAPGFQPTAMIALYF